MVTKNLKILIAAGGTGGHVFPGIAVAEAVKRMAPDARVLFAGTTDGIESKLVPELGWEIVHIGSHSTHAGGVVNRALSYLKVPFLILRARKMLDREKPDAVIGTGGFAAGPLVLAAALKKIPTAIVEPNAVAGRANRKLARFVNRVFVGFSSAAKAFPPRKVSVTGAPVRRSIAESRNHHRDDQCLTLLCYGGSQGAKALNDVMVAMTPYVEKHGDRLRIIHQVGRIEEVEKIADIYKRAQLEAEVFPFSMRIADLYREADIALARAGAGTVAELAVAGIPAVLVPLPHAVDDHQRANARQIANGGGAILVEQEALTGESLANIVIDFIEHPDKLEHMRILLAGVAKPGASERIAKETLELAGMKRK